MKNTFSDITHKVNRSLNKIDLINLTSDNTYWVVSNSDWKINRVIREMENVNLLTKVHITINGIFVPKKYYLTESSNANGITVKFIKSLLPYSIDVEDTIKLKGDLTPYA